MGRKIFAALAALAFLTTQARAPDFAAVRIKVETARHGSSVDAAVTVTNEGASRIDALVIACTMLDARRRPLDIHDGYLTDIVPGATFVTKLLFFVPSGAEPASVACHPVEMRPRVAGVLLSLS
jgi:hypothetical protein